MGRLTYVGPSGAGQLCKLANQQIVAITIGAVAEAMMLVEAGGASGKVFAMPYAAVLPKAGFWSCMASAW